MLVLAQVRLGFELITVNYTLDYSLRRASVSLRGSTFCEVFSLEGVQLGPEGLTFGFLLF